MWSCFFTDTMWYVCGVLWGNALFIWTISTADWDMSLCITGISLWWAVSLIDCAVEYARGGGRLHELVHGSYQGPRNQEFVVGVSSQDVDQGGCVIWLEGDLGMILNKYMALYMACYGPVKFNHTCIDFAKGAIHREPHRFLSVCQTWDFEKDVFAVVWL